MVCTSFDDLFRSLLQSKPDNHILDVDNQPCCKSATEDVKIFRADNLKCCK